jgi:hypothetical protein
MDEKPRKRSSGKVVCLVVLVVLLGVPVLYCLSSGPAAILVERGYVHGPDLDGFYGPLGDLIYWLDDQLPQDPETVGGPDEPVFGLYVRYIIWWHRITNTPYRG